MQRVQGDATTGNVTVNTVGNISTTIVEGSFPAATVTVFNQGTLVLSSIFGDNGVTPKANPFSAGADGSWFFYAANGRYDITLAATGLSKTLGDVLLDDPAGNQAFGGNVTIAGTLGVTGATTLSTLTTTGAAALQSTVSITGQLTESASLKLAEIAAPAGAAGFDILWADSTAHRLKVSDNNGAAVQLVQAGVDINTSDQVTVTHLAAPLPRTQGGTEVNSTATFPTTGVIVTEAAVETLTNKTLTAPAITAPAITGAATIATGATITSPTINGTPTGTGIPTATIKGGTGAGNYTTASTTFVRVDAANLVLAGLTIPVGWKLMIHASGCVSQATATVGVDIALADGVADNTGILIVVHASPGTAGVDQFSPFSLIWIIVGDGASHTINLQYLTGAGADSAIMVNSSATLRPIMTFLLTPSN